MLSHPKPASRALKPRKPIKRTPSRPKRSTSRTHKTRCADPKHPRCHKTPLHLGRCGTHADEYLLRLRRAIVVKATCELGDWHRMTNTRCSEDPCDNHGIGRSYTRGNLRWIGPGFSGCSGANATAYYRPMEWQEFLRRRWGLQEYQRLVDIALHGPKADYEEAERALVALKKEA